MILSGYLKKDAVLGLTTVVTVLSGLYLLGTVAIYFLPESKGQELPE